MLKAVVTSLDDVQEQFHSLYSESGDQFILQIDGADSLPDVRNLKSAYEREKEKRVKAQTERDEAISANKNMPEDFDIEVWNKAKSGETDSAAIEAAKVEVRKLLEGERDEWKTKYNDLVLDGRKTTAEMQLTDALTKAGVSDEAFLRASRALLNPMIEFGDDGEPRFQSDMGPMGVSDFVERWAKGDGKSFVRQAEGGGSRNKNGGASDGASPPASWSEAKTAKDKAALIKAQREA
jgi:hypothetical protein